MTRIVYVGGNFRISYATENHYALSFEAAGCDVRKVNEQGLTRKALLRAIEEFEPELLLWTRVHPVDPSIGDVLANPPDGVVTAAVHLDVFFGLPRMRELGEHPMWRCQHVFTPDGDASDVLWGRYGINHHWLPPAVVDPALVGEQVPGTPRPERWPFEVAFVGSRGYHPEHPRAELVDWLTATYGDRFAHVGGDGQVRGRGGGAMREQELNDFYATVPVIVGDSCFARAESRYWSDRFPETWGRGGYLVFPHIDALRRLMSGYPSWRDYEELRETISDALWDPQLREDRRERLGAEVRLMHTYTDRAREILDVVL